MKYTIFLFVLAILISCEKEITPTLNTAEEIIVIDAWLNQKPERQEIRITRSQPYFENAHPEKIPGADVIVEDLTSAEVYQFIEGDSSYYWDPTSSVFGEVGHEYRLQVSIDNETFEAYSTLGRVPPVDSVGFRYNDKDQIITDPYYTAEFLATDPVGEGDTYWIKAFKNGEFLNKPNELNMVWDAGFSPSQSADGAVFMLPIRKDFINPYDRLPDKDNQFHPPYEVGDSVYVEIHSIDKEAFDFLYKLYFYINRPGGFAEMFAMPLANTSTNIKNINSTSVTPFGGFFCVSSVSTNGAKLSEEIAKKAKKKAGY